MRVCVCGGGKGVNCHASTFSHAFHMSRKQYTYVCNPCILFSEISNSLISKYPQKRNPYLWQVVSVDKPVRLVEQHSSEFHGDGGEILGQRQLRVGEPEQGRRDLLHRQKHDRKLEHYRVTIVENRNTPNRKSARSNTQKYAKSGHGKSNLVTGLLIKRER